MKYSWTKKNFGMDRDVVADSIIRNCKREECLKSMRMEMARLSNSLCSNALNPAVPQPQPFPEMAFGMPAALPCLPPYTYRWPFAFPVPPVFHPADFPIQIPFFADMYGMGNPMAACNQTLGVNPMTDPGVDVPQPRADGHKREADTNCEIPVPMEAVSKSSANPIAVKDELEVPPITLRFKKPKNVYEYKNLMEAARIRPAEYPDILAKEKTQFLSILGIAPKSVCSTRTLRKFRKELRHKLLMNRECMIYTERKALRDKNKLRKFSHEKPKHQFLGMVARKDPPPKNLEKSRNDAATSKQPKLLKASKKSNYEQSDNDAKKMKVSYAEKIEVIDIISSDEESQQGNASKDELFAVSEPKKQSNGLSNNSISESTGKISGVKNNMKITKGNYAENKKNKNESEDKSETSKDGESLNVENAIPKNGNSSGKNPAGTEGKLSSPTSHQVQKLDSYLNAKPLLLPKVVKHIPILSKSTNPSNNPLETKCIQTSRILISSNASRVNVMPKYSTNYVLSSSNVAPPVVIRPSNVQQTIVVSDASSAPKIVYPLTVSQPSTNNVKLLLTDKDQKGAFYVTPRYNRPILPQTYPINSTFDPEKPNAMPSISSQLQQLKQMKAERKRILLDQMYNQEKSKIDIGEEMSRISKWIYRMKANLNPNMFQHGIEKPVHKLLSQLDIGICLVREAKKSLTEIENSLGSEMPSAEDDE